MSLTIKGFLFCYLPLFSRSAKLSPDDMKLFVKENAEFIDFEELEDNFSDKVDESKEYKQKNCGNYDKRKFSCVGNVFNKPEGALKRSPKCVVNMDNIDAEGERCKEAYQRRSNRILYFKSRKKRKEQNCIYRKNRAYVIAEKSVKVGNRFWDAFKVKRPIDKPRKVIGNKKGKEKPALSRF